jgi:hypothetical protein
MKKKSGAKIITNKNRVLKMHQSSFISTNRAGKFIERCINIPL